jgi:hypothetical protein
MDLCLPEALARVPVQAKNGLGLLTGVRCGQVNALADDGGRAVATPR